MTVQELFSDKSKWGQDHNGVDKDGYPVGANDPRAVRWCLTGALIKCYGENRGRELRSMLYRHLKTDVEIWNDDPARTFDEVRDFVAKRNL